MNLLEKIVFLTHDWTGITSAVRSGQPLAGTVSVFKLWERCVVHGIQTHVFILAPEETPGPMEFTALNGVSFHWIKPFGHQTKVWCSAHRLGWLTYWFKLVDWVKVFCHCRKTAPDAQVYYSQRYGLAIVALVLAYLARGKAVVRYYGSPLYEQLTSGRPREWLRAMPSILVMKLPFALHIMTNDGTRGDWAFEKLKVPKVKTRFWLNGIRTDMHDSSVPAANGKLAIGHGVKDVDPLLLCVGRLADWKRQDILIRAVPEIRRFFPNVKLLLIGRGEQSEKYRELATQLGVDQSTIFYGPVGNSDLPRFLNCCDIYLQVNDRSNVSTTLIEALSAGCCCVARNEGAIDSIVEDGENAVLVSTDDPSDLAQVVVDLLSNPDRMAQLRHNALTDAHRRFQSWNERLDTEIADLKRITQAD